MTTWTAGTHISPSKSVVSAPRLRAIALPVIWPIAGLWLGLIDRLADTTGRVERGLRRAARPFG